MNRVVYGDCVEIMRRWVDEGVRAQMCVTSPPYWGLRDYGVAGQLGLERTPEEYIAAMLEVFREVKRVLRDDGTLWLNMGDSYHGSWGNAGSRPELDGKTQNQREKNVKYLNRGGWDERRERPPSSYKINGLKPKDLVGIPWMLAFALRADGWYLRQDIIWAKPNPMPESVRDRCTRSHEYIFLLAKERKYYFDSRGIAEPMKRPEELFRKTPAVFGGRDKFEAASKQSRLHSGNPYCYKGSTFDRGKTGEAHKNTSIKPRQELFTRNKRDVWNVSTKPFKGAHFATFPPDLIEPCILAGSRPGDIVLDPFIGSGTTAQVALQHGRQYLGCELNPAYKELIDKRIEKVLDRQSHPVQN